MTKDHILVIKHGALGDIVIATAGFAAIRDAYPDAHIVCMTTKPYAELLATSPYFNEIWVDSKPEIFEREALLRLRTMLHSYPWSFVFDLQASKRTTRYQWLLKRPWPSISNISRFASHGHRVTAQHTKRHALRNLQLQLQIAGLEVGDPDLSWMHADIAHLKPHGDYILLIPGGAPHRPAKRWPAEQFAALAQELARKKLIPVLLGTKAEEDTLKQIAARVPEALNLCGRTSIAHIAELARGAKLAVGNDTGPMHVIAGVGCPATVLFSHDSDPARCAPVGRVKVLRRKHLADLSVDEVLTSLQ